MATKSKRPTHDVRLVESTEDGYAFRAVPTAQTDHPSLFFELRADFGRPARLAWLTFEASELRGLDTADLGVVDVDDLVLAGLDAVTSGISTYEPPRKLARRSTRTRADLVTAVDLWTTAATTAEGREAIKRHFGLTSDRIVYYYLAEARKHPDLRALIERDGKQRKVGS